MWPAYLKWFSFLNRFNLGFSNRRSWRSRLLFNWQIGKRYAKHGDVFRLREIVIGNSAKSSADNLLTQQLTGECSDTENVRNSLCVPTFREHVHTNNALHLFSGFAFLADSVHFFSNRFGKLAFILGHLSSFVRFNFIKCVLINAKQTFFVAQLTRNDMSVFDSIFNSGRCELSDKE